MKREKYLSKAIICSLLTASAISVSATAMAAETTTTPHQAEWGTMTGSVLHIDEGTNVIHVDDGKEHSETGVTLSVSENEQKKGTSAIRVLNKGTSLEISNSDISGGSVTVKDGGSLTINNSTVVDGPYYENGQLSSGGTEFETVGGTIVVNDSTIKNTIYAGASEDGKIAGKIILNNTNVAIGPHGDGSITADYNSEIYLNGGTYDTTGMDFVGSMKLKGDDTQPAGKIYLNGGTLIANNLRALTDGSKIIPDASDEDDKSEIITKGIVLQNNGVIKTQTGEIFANSAANKTTDSGAVTNDYIDYQGGVLEFTDSEYTIDYLVSANKNMSDKGSTSIAMIGKLVNDDGSAVGSITVDQAAGIGDAKLDTVTVTANENKDEDIHTLTVTNNKDVEETGVQKANSFNAAVLDLNGTIKTVNVESGKQLGLGGSKGGDLLTNGAEGLTVKVNGGALNINREGVSADSTLNAAINATGVGGEVNSLGGNNTVNGDVSVTNNATLNVKGDSTLTVSGALTGDNTSKIIVGTADRDNPDNNSAGTLISGNTNLNGATVFLDPMWKDGDTIGDGSKAGLAFADNKVDGKLVVGMNSVLSLGTTDTSKAEKAFAKTGETWGKDGILSAVYVEGSHDVSNGILFVDPDAESTSANSKPGGTVIFNTNSILIVDGTKVTGDKAALTGINHITFAENTEGKSNGAKLYIDNADKGTYNILSKAETSSQELKDAITSDNIISNINMLQFSSTDAEGKVTAKYKDANTVYTGSNSLVIDDVVNKTLQSDKIKSGNAAYDFFRKAIDGNVNGTTAAQADAINSSANLGALGGVNHAAYSASNLMTDSVTDHLSLASHEYNGSDIWAKYIHSKEDIDGMELGGLDADYDASFDGITVGGDFYNKGKGTVGAAFSYAKGDIDGYTLSSRTQNDADYYGLSLYGRIDNGDSAVLGDISYMHGSNDVKQYNSGTEITASPDSDVFSIGVRAEKMFKAGENGKVVPYAGLRYMHLGTGDYTNSLGMSYDAGDQNLWLIPVGVKFTTEIKHNDWTISPYAEAGYVWTAGDRETDQSVSLNGGINAFSFETADKSSFIGKLGVQAESDTMLYGLGYEYQNGDTVSADKWMANVTFKF